MVVWSAPGSMQRPQAAGVDAARKRRGLCHSAHGRRTSAKNGIPATRPATSSRLSRHDLLAEELPIALICTPDLPSNLGLWLCILHQLISAIFAFDKHASQRVARRTFAPSLHGYFS